MAIQLQTIPQREAVSLLQRTIHPPLPDGEEQILNKEMSHLLANFLDTKLLFTPKGESELPLPSLLITMVEFLNVWELYNKQEAHVKGFRAIDVRSFSLIGSNAARFVCPELFNPKGDIDLLFLAQFHEDDIVEQKRWCSLLFGKVLYDFILRQPLSMQQANLLENYWKGEGDPRTAFRNQSTFSSLYCRRTGFGENYSPAPRSGVCYTFDSLLDCTVLYLPQTFIDFGDGVEIDITSYVREGDKRFPLRMQREQIDRALRCMKESHFEIAEQVVGVKFLFRLADQMGRGLHTIDPASRLLVDEAFIRAIDTFASKLKHYLSTHKMSHKQELLFLLHLQALLRQIQHEGKPENFVLKLLQEKLGWKEEETVIAKACDLWIFSLYTRYKNQAIWFLYEERDSFGTFFSTLYPKEFFIEQLMSLSQHSPEMFVRVGQLDHFFGLPTLPLPLLQRGLQLGLEEDSLLTPELLDRFWSLLPSYQDKVQLLLWAVKKKQPMVERWLSLFAQENSDKQSLQSALALVCNVAYETDESETYFTLFLLLREAWGDSPFHCRYQKLYCNFIRTLPFECVIKMNRYLFWDYQILSQGRDMFSLCYSCADSVSDSFFAHSFFPQWRKWFLDTQPMGSLSFHFFREESGTFSKSHIEQILSFLHETETLSESWCRAFKGNLPVFYKICSVEDLFTLVRLYSEITKENFQDFDGFAAYLHDCFQRDRKGAYLVAIKNLFSQSNRQLSESLFAFLMMQNDEEMFEELLGNWEGTGLPLKQLFSLRTKHSTLPEIEFIKKIIQKSSQPKNLILGWLDDMVEAKRYHDMVQQIDEILSLLHFHFPQTEERVESFMTLMLKMNEEIIHSFQNQNVVNDVAQLLLLNHLLSICLQKEHRVESLNFQDRFYEFFKKMQISLSAFYTVEECNLSKIYNDFFTVYPQSRESRERELKRGIIVFLWQGNLTHFGRGVRLFQEWFPPHSLSNQQDYEFLIEECSQFFLLRSERYFAEHEILVVDYVDKVEKEKRCKAHLETVNNTVAEHRLAVNRMLQEKKPAQEIKDELEAGKGLYSLQKKSMDLYEEQSSQTKEAELLLRTQKEIHHSHILLFIPLLDEWLSRKEPSGLSFFTQHERVLDPLHPLSQSFVAYKESCEVYRKTFVMALCTKLQKNSASVAEWQLFMEKVVLPFIDAYGQVMTVEERIVYKGIKEFLLDIETQLPVEGKRALVLFKERIQSVQRYAFESYLRIFTESNIRLGTLEMIDLLDLDSHSAFPLLKKEDFQHFALQFMQNAQEEELGIETEIALFIIIKMLQLRGESNLSDEWKASSLCNACISQNAAVSQELQEALVLPFSERDIDLLLRLGIESDDKNRTLWVLTEKFLTMISLYCNHREFVRRFLIANCQRPTEEMLLRIGSGAELLMKKDEDREIIHRINCEVLDFFLSDQNAKNILLETKITYALRLAGNNCMLWKASRTPPVEQLEQFVPIFNLMFSSYLEKKIPQFYEFEEIYKRLWAEYISVVSVSESPFKIELYKHFIDRLLLPCMERFATDPRIKNHQETANAWFIKIMLLGALCQLIKEESPSVANQDSAIEIQKVRTREEERFAARFFIFSKNREEQTKYLLNCMGNHAIRKSLKLDTQGLLWLGSHLQRMKRDRHTPLHFSQGIQQILDLLSGNNEEKLILEEAPRVKKKKKKAR